MSSYKQPTKIKRFNLWKKKKNGTNLGKHKTAAEQKNCEDITVPGARTNVRLFLNIPSSFVMICPIGEILFYVPNYK